MPKLAPLPVRDAPPLISTAIFRFNDGKVAIWHVQSGARDNSKYTNFEMQFVTPAGDPVDAPVDVGEGQNEFTFSNGRLTIDLSASAMPSGVAQRVAKNCIFRVEEIGSSKINWSKECPNGAAKEKDERIISRVTFEGMPFHNSDFGRKKAFLLYDGKMLVQNDYEVFFPADECGHPADNINGGSVDSLNWYYYWREGALWLDWTNLGMSAKCLRIL